MDFYGQMAGKGENRVSKSEYDLLKEKADKALPVLAGAAALAAKMLPGLGEAALETVSGAAGAVKDAAFAGQGTGGTAADQKSVSVDPAPPIEKSVTRVVDGHAVRFQRGLRPAAQRLVIR